MKATEIKNYQNLTAKGIVSYMKNNNISTITSGKIEYSVDDIEDSWEYILEKEKVLVPLFCYGLSNFVGAGFAGTGTNAPKVAYNNSANAIAMTFGGSTFLGTTSNGSCWTTQNPNATSLPPVAPQRSEERRVGKEC